MMNVDQEVEIPVTTVETVITTTGEDVPILETTVEEVCEFPSAPAYNRAVMAADIFTCYIIPQSFLQYIFC